MFLFTFPPDRKPVHEDRWAEGQDEAARSQEGEDLGRRHAGSSAGLQSQRVGGLQGQPQDCEEGGGEGKPHVFLILSFPDIKQHR